MLIDGVWRTAPGGRQNLMRCMVVSITTMSRHNLWFPSCTSYLEPSEEESRRDPLRRGHERHWGELGRGWRVCRNFATYVTYVNWTQYTGCCMSNSTCDSFWICCRKRVWSNKCGAFAKSCDCSDCCVSCSRIHQAFSAQSDRLLSRQLQTWLP